MPFAEAPLQAPKPERCTAALWFGRLRCLWHLGHRATEPGPHGQRFEPPVAPRSRCFFCVFMVFLDITTVWLICFLEII